MSCSSLCKHPRHHLRYDSLLPSSFRLVRIEPPKMCGSESIWCSHFLPRITFSRGRCRLLISTGNRQRKLPPHESRQGLFPLRQRRQILHSCRGYCFPPRTGTHLLRFPPRHHQNPYGPWIRAPWRTSQPKPLGYTVRCRPPALGLCLTIPPISNGCILPNHHNRGPHNHYATNGHSSIDPTGPKTPHQPMHASRFCHHASQYEKQAHPPL